MNDSQSAQRDDAGPPKQDGAPVSVSRRRFAKGAAPVLLGTLASKPVLGAEYICAVSGYASGNASAHETDDRVCAVGDDEASWLGDDWAGISFPITPGLKKGSLPTASTDTKPKICDFGTEGLGTIFNGLTLGGATLSATFYYAIPANDCRVNQNSNRPAASLYQVLARTGGGVDSVFNLGRVTVTSLLNTARYPKYPVMAGRIIEMFNAVVNDGGTYHVDGANLNMTRTGVITYLRSLYS